LKIYFDNCCFNRPFDNQKNIKIFLETHAKLYIQQKILEGLNPKDALHVSCAKYAGCDCFFTTDKGILKKSMILILLRNLSHLQIQQIMKRYMRML